DDVDWRFAERINADIETHSATDGFYLINCLLNRQRSAVVRLSRDAHAAFATIAAAKIWRPHMTAIRRNIGKIQNRQPAKVVMNPAQLRFRQYLDGRIRS